MTQSIQRRSSLPWRRYTPTSRKPSVACSARLAVFSGKIREASFQ
jgi:hypothetical protein